MSNEVRASTPPRIESVAEVPSRLGRYELLVRIGAGGAATVFLARHEVVAGTYREVAVKVLHPAAGIDHGDAIHFVEEARVAARIRHPNVVPVLEVGEERGRLFLVMEYVEGDSVIGLLRHARAARHRIPLRIAGRIVVDALAGLHAAHELRNDDGVPLELVHRDFTPHNVLVGVDGTTRLTDFGIAKTIDRNAFTATGLVKGKLAYMPPEQALGRPLDRRCDVWAAGVVAWELLASERMVLAESDAAVLLNVLQNGAPRLGTRVPGLPAEIDDAIAAALERDPERRLPSAEALRSRLVTAFQLSGDLADPTEVGAYVRGAAAAHLARIGEAKSIAIVAAAVPSRRPIEPRRTRRWRLRTAVTAVSAAVVAALSFGMLRANRRGDRGQLERGEAVASDPIPTAPAVSSADADAAAGDPDASPPRASQVELSADAPFSSIRVGERRVPLSQPTRHVVLSLTAAEAAAALPIVATTPDGRTAEAVVSPGAQGTVTIRFPAPRPLAAPVQRRHSGELPGLAPPQY